MYKRKLRKCTGHHEEEGWVQMSTAAKRGLNGLGVCERSANRMAVFVSAAVTSLLLS